MMETRAALPEIVELGGIDLSRAIHKREVSCVDVMQAYLTHIERINPQVNALVSMRPAFDCLQSAREADQSLQRGDSTGWMHGFPQAPKDIAPVAGMVTTRGSAIYRGRVTSSDGRTVARMREAGAIFIARTNVPEFGLGSHTYNSVYGLTGNAFDPTRTAGGSSGGAAAAVALRMLPVADGSDMMGSLRNPAAFNNVFGFRPSFGRVPGGPSAEVFFSHFGTGGPIARSVADLAMLLSVQAGPAVDAPLSLQEDPGIFTASLKREMKGSRVGWLGSFDGHLAIEPGVMDVCVRALARLTAIGCDVAEARVRFSMESLWSAWTTLRSFSVAGNYNDLYENPDSRALMKPEALWEIDRGRSISGLELHRAACIRSAWYQEICRLFETFDYLVLPSAQVFPFAADLAWPRTIAGQAMDSYHRWMEVTIPATLAGLPALNVPAGFSADGLPMGIQLMGRPRADLDVLALGHAYEQASDVARRRSPLLGGTSDARVSR